MVFDFVDGGAEDEVTVRGNESCFDEWWLRPQILNDVTSRDQRIELLGTSLPTPLVLAPAGLAGLVWPHGEAVAAAAASKAGIPFAVSTASSCSIEEVREAADGPLWLQLYLWRDREVTGSLVERAANAGYQALCLTVDVPLSGQRERDLRNGMTIPPRITVRNSLGVLSRPRWMIKMAGAPVTFANVSDGRKGRTMALGAYVNSQLNPSASWDDLRWLRSKWPGKLLVKGVLDAASARRLVDEGVDAVIVSNHGGRQLDSAVPALAALPDVVDGRGNSSRHRRHQSRGAGCVGVPRRPALPVGIGSGGRRGRVTSDRGLAEGDRPRPGALGNSNNHRGARAGGAIPCECARLPLQARSRT
jgi:L-lactate dehydrogenase (cytochrome)